MIILAGGSGERLWPVSDDRKPKQFMALSDGISFLQAAIQRAAALSISDTICIITRRSWIDLAVEEVVSLSEKMGLPDLPGKVLVMGEPFGKNTAPAIAWYCRYLEIEGRADSANILLMASDHIIESQEQFTRDAMTASLYSSQNNLVSFSIVPTHPATGYGYIKAGERLVNPDGTPSSAYVVESFREKPDAHTASSYLAQGSYYWNSGIYAFRSDFYMEQIGEHCPALLDAFRKVPGTSTIEAVQGVRVMRSWDGLETAYTASPSISIDYAMSEKCDRSVTVAAGFSWDDVGTWDSMAGYYPDLPENTVSVSASNCFVRSDIPVALCDVHDIIVVIHEGKALVSRRGSSNLVKDALAAMKEKHIQ